MQPAGPLDPCPVAGTVREFDPVSDIHIGIISSSLGGHGADACPDQENNSCAPSPNFTNNDKGHLVARADACGGALAPTYQGKGFLAWDPKQVLMPPGEGNITSFNDALRDMTLGVGQVGCGYESQLESWYRFLADPEPYEAITVVDNKVALMGVDSVLLAQRADFLRPDSLLAILMVTDEDDCSIKEVGQFFYAAQLKSLNGMAFHLPRPRVECLANPNDPCCLSCGQSQGSCPTDPSCLDGNMVVKPLTDLEDPTNLRCFDQKRRFGIDFLYPIDRYTTALTSKKVPNRTGELVPNPIFSDLNPTDNSKVIRDSGLVFLAGIVGVPWQDIARKADDLTEGFKDADELVASNTWSVILGEPSQYVPPSDPHMIASISPRSGSNPITGDAIVPPGQGAVNPINGSEYTIPAKDDLQYACIFPLAAPRDCSDPSIVFCDCKDPSNDSRSASPARSTRRSARCRRRRRRTRGCGTCRSFGRSGHKALRRRPARRSSRTRACPTTAMCLR
jgi:hypothetical protein